MVEQVTNTSSGEISILLLRSNAILRLVSITSAFVFWFLVSLLCFVLYLHNLFPYTLLLPYAQAVSLIGLSPIAAAALTWKFFEFCFSSYVIAYSKKHWQK